MGNDEYVIGKCDAVRNKKIPRRKRSKIDTPKAHTYDRSRFWFYFCTGALILTLNYDCGEWEGVIVCVECGIMYWKKKIKMKINSSDCMKII